MESISSYINKNGFCENKIHSYFSRETLKRLFMRLLFFFFLLLTNDVFSQSNENTRDVIKRNGIIKETVYPYNYNNGVIVDSVRHPFIILYNDSGNIAEKRTVETSLIQSIECYWYNTRNKLMKFILYDDSSKTKPILIDSHYYDERNNDIAENNIGYKVGFLPTDTMTTINIAKRIYNAKNQLIEAFSSLEKNVDLLYKRIQFFYNKNGDIDKILVFKENGELNYTHIYRYKKENTTILIQDNLTNNIYLFSKCFYNDEKQIIRKTYHYKQNRIEIFTYNSDGTLFEKKITSDGKATWLEKHFYEKR